MPAAVDLVQDVASSVKKALLNLDINEGRHEYLVIDKAALEKYFKKEWGLK